MVAVSWFLIRNSITAVHRKDLESDCEMLWLELHTSRGIINFVTYYRPPTATTDSLRSLHSALGATSTSLPIIVCGDCNAPDVAWLTTSPKVKSPVADTLCEFVCNNFFIQLVSHPTRGDNILDLLLTTNPDLISSVRVTDSLPGCDHDAIHFMLSTSRPHQSTIKRVLYNYKQLILMILKKFGPVFPGKLLTMRMVILSYHGLNGKIYFSLLWIMCFH